MENFYRKMTRKEALNCLVLNDSDYNCHFVYEGTTYRCPCYLGIPDECMEESCFACWQKAINKHKIK